MVAFGTFLSAFWILAVNSWMQTPAGHAMNAAGQFVPEDWWAVVFNPSFPYRLVHMVLAAYLSTAFIVGGTGALHLLRDVTQPASRIMFSMAMWMAALVAPLQIVAGDLHGLNTLEHQPAKIAAMEGHFETRAGAPLLLFGLPDMQAERTRYAVEIPRLGSLILTHDLQWHRARSQAVAREDRPNAAVVFWSFRVMVGAGFAMLAVGIWSLVLRLGGACSSNAACCASPLCWARLASSPCLPAGSRPRSVASRTPFTACCKTADSVSAVDAAAVGSSLVAFIIVYFAVFGAGAFYMLRLMRHAPAISEPDLRCRRTHAGQRTHARPGHGQQGAATVNRTMDRTMTT